MNNKGLRPELAEFVEAMEVKLEENNYKSDWEDESLEYLVRRVMEEVEELLAAFRMGTGMADEAVDVASFAMMVYSKTKMEKI